MTAPKTLHYVIAGAVIIALTFAYLKGKQDGTDNMKRLQVTHDLEVTKKDEELRDSISKANVSAISVADSVFKARRIESSRPTGVHIKDSTHVVIGKLVGALPSHPGVPDSIAETLVELPVEVIQQLTQDSLDYEREHTLRIHLQDQIRIDSTVILDQKVTIGDLQKLKDKPGVISDAITGAVTGAITGAILQGGRGAVAGSGVGLLASTILHILFRK